MLIKLHYNGETIFVLLKVMFDFALVVWFGIGP